MHKVIAVFASAAILVSGGILASSPAGAVGGAGGSLAIATSPSPTVGQPLSIDCTATPATDFTFGGGQSMFIRVSGSVVASGSPDVNGPKISATLTPLAAGPLTIQCLYIFTNINGGTELENSSVTLTVQPAPVAPALPTITGITPSSSPSPGGGTAEITGTLLSTATGVTIGSAPAGIVAATDSKVVVTVPRPASSDPLAVALDVTVQTPAGALVLTGAFTYTATAPAVSALQPSCAVTPGVSVIVTGNHFAGATAVTIGGVSAPFTVTNPAEIGGSLTTSAPALAGSQPVVVTTAAGSSSGLLPLSYQPCSPMPAFTVTTVSTVPAGGFATLQWNFSPTDPNLGNVLGLQWATSLAGPWQNVGTATGGPSGTFTVSGLTRQRGVVWVKAVNKDPQGQPEVANAAVSFATAPTPLPPNAGPAGGVPAAPVASVGSSSGIGAGDATGSTGSAGSTNSGSSGASTGAGASSAVGAPCVAPVGSMYADTFGTVGSQLVAAPGRPGQATPTRVVVTSGALPPGMILDAATGIAYGVPTAAGKYSATLAGRGAKGAKVTSVLNFTIDNDPQTLTYPVLMVGGRTQTLMAGPTTNAPAGSTYEIVCGKLPAGLSFSTRTGIISGTPTRLALKNPPLRVVERNAAGSAAASFVVLVTAKGVSRLSYPSHPHLRLAKRVTIRPSVVAAGDLLYYKVVRGKLNKGLTFHPRTGLITGKPKRAGGAPHVVTVAGVHADGTLVPANPMTIVVRR